MKKVNHTIHDIARELNTTASTVSRALNNSPRISLSMKNSILNVARKLNYQPNHLAAALRKGRSKMIGIIVPTLDRSFFSSAIRAIEEVANENGYSVILCQTQEDFKKEKASIHTLLKAKVEGIIVSHSKTTSDFEHFEQLKHTGIPIILFDRINEALDVSQVAINDFLGGYYATTHLIEQGCRRIAHFTSNQQIHLFKERLRGYQQALLDHNIEYDESIVIESELQPDDGRHSMIRLMEGRQFIDGILSASALAALGAIKLIKERKLKVPDDVAVVGFSDELASRLSNPPLTIIDQHSIHVGREAAKILFDQLLLKRDINISPTKIILKPSLIIRQSSRRIKTQG